MYKAVAATAVSNYSYGNISLALDRLGIIGSYQQAGPFGYQFWERPVHRLPSRIGKVSNGDFPTLFASKITLLHEQNHCNISFQGQPLHWVQAACNDAVQVVHQLEHLSFCHWHS